MSIAILQNSWVLIDLPLITWFQNLAWGSDDLNNLALACRRCNERRYNFIAGVDPETQEIVPIFNPRQQKWKEHFVWLDQGTIIQGTTPTGRATCIRLDLNDTRYPENDSIRETRRFWIKTGVHPPTDDLR